MRRALLVAVAVSCLGIFAVSAQGYTGAFLSFPHQSGPQSFSGNDVVVANRSYVGFSTKVCLTVSNAHNVTLHDLDFDSCGGGIFLINVTGTVSIENIRGRNIGDGTIGSGHSNLIQFNNVWQGAPELPNGAARVRHIKEYGGDTEDVISVFKSGGVDSAHPLVLGDIHIEHPLSGALAWSSGSGTCANLADAGGHDIRLQNSTFLNCGAVGIQMNEPDRNVKAKNNVLYGAARTTSNVGLSQWSSGTCSNADGCPGNVYRANRINWKKATGSQSDIWLSGRYPVALINNTTNAAINPANLHVDLNAGTTTTTVATTTTTAPTTTTTQPAVSYRDTVMADSPLAYWRFATTSSETGNYAGTLRGSPAPLLGQPGPFGDLSIRFDGVLRDNTTTQGFLVNALARLPSATWANGFTLESWANTTTSGPEQHVMTWSDGAGNAGPGILYDDPDNAWKFRDGNVSLSMNGTTTINAWHYLVASVDSAGNGTLYVDGVNVRTWNSGVKPIASSTGLFTVGADYDAHTCPCPHVDTPFNGWLAETAVYAHPLSQARVQAHFAAR